LKFLRLQTRSFFTSVPFLFVLANCLATHNSSRVASREFCGRSPKKLPTLRNHKSKCRRVPKEKRKKKTQINKNSQKIFRLPLTVRFHQRQSGNKLTANRPLAKYINIQIIFQSDNREIYKGTGTYTEKNILIYEYI